MNQNLWFEGVKSYFLWTWKNLVLFFSCFFFFALLSLKLVFTESVLPWGGLPHLHIDKSHQSNWIYQSTHCTPTTVALDAWIQGYLRWKIRRDPSLRDRAQPTIGPDWSLGSISWVLIALVPLFKFASHSGIRAQWCWQCCELFERISVNDRPSIYKHLQKNSGTNCQETSNWSFKIEDQLQPLPHFRGHPCGWFICQMTRQRINKVVTVRFYEALCYRDFWLLYQWVSDRMSSDQLVRRDKPRFI